jgi:signal transduction histidine kinase
MNTAQKSLNYHFNKAVEARSSAEALGRQPPSKSSNNYIQTYTQVRNLNGEFIQGPANSENIRLPLSDEGLHAVKQGQPWVETAWLDTERFFVRSQLVEGPEENTEILQVAFFIEDRYEFLNELRNILVISDSLVIIVAFGIGWVLAGLTLRPIDRVTQTAKTVGEERDFGQRVEHTGPNDEIGQLATTFNNMLAQLQDAYVQVEQSLQAQRRFVADASHELRTPLTTIRGNISLLQREPPINVEDEVDILDDTVDETDRLIRLVNDLLVLARADARQSLRCEPIQLKPFLEDLSRQAILLAPQRTIVCQPVPDLIVNGDRDALKQVMLVLLDNALKHTPPEATITMAAAVAGEQITVSVRDNGPGIESSQLAHIFDRFYRGDAARSGPGTGLGLAIADELVKAQNGTLTVESRVGLGSLFTLTFPMPPPIAGNGGTVGDNGDR